ncbi:MAG: thiamine pyrophosphate-binding protein [Dehalococcoidia bacterium]
MANLGNGRYGSDVIVDLLQRYGIEYASLNPGASYRGLHDSIVNYGGNSPRIVECQHEEIAVQIAHGYAKASGKPMVAILHDLVGLLHACMAIYYAYIDRAPILILGGTGPMNESRRRPRVDWIHTALVQGNAVRDYTKWDDQPSCVEAFPESFARAYRVALTEPQGPVYLCYDAQLQEDAISSAVRLPNVDSARVPSRMQADLSALERLAGMLVEAKQPVFLVEYLGHDTSTVPALVKLAETVGAAVWDLRRRANFPNPHPLNLTDADVLAEADLIVGLDLRNWERPLTRLDSMARTLVPLTRPDCVFAEVGFADLELSSWSLDFQRFKETSLSILADTSMAVPVLAEMCGKLVQNDPQAESRIRARRQALGQQQRALRSRWQEEARAQWDEAAPLSPARVAGEVWEAIRHEDWVLTAGSMEDWAHRLWEFDQPYRYAGGALGTATHIGISLGVALAHKGSGRLVVDLQPDGDLMFDIGALWVASKHEIPILLVMHNNRAYWNDWEHQIRVARQRGRRVENAYVGMDIDKPAPDFATVAKAFGWHGEGPLERPEDIQPALQRAIRAVKSGQPALVDTWTSHPASRRR